MFSMFSHTLLLQELKGVDFDNFWNPLLYIDNILSETKEATWLTATVNHKGEAYILERRRIRGVFLENLELNDFPLDVQVRVRPYFILLVSWWPVKKIYACTLLSFRFRHSLWCKSLSYFG